MRPKWGIVLTKVVKKVYFLIAPLGWMESEMVSKVYLRALSQGRWKCKSGSEFADQGRFVVFWFVFLIDCGCPVCTWVAWGSIRPLSVKTQLKFDFRSETSNSCSGTLIFRPSLLISYRPSCDNGNKGGMNEMDYVFHHKCFSSRL
jgi:hypothetical protein